MGTNKNRIISEEDMTKLGEEFQSSKESIDTITTSLDSMRTSLVDDVYDGCAVDPLKSDFDKLKKESENLSYVYNALNLFTARVISTFKQSDTSAAEEAKTNVAKTD